MLYILIFSTIIISHHISVDIRLYNCVLILYFLCKITLLINLFNCNYKKKSFLCIFFLLFSYSTALPIFPCFSFPSSDVFTTVYLLFIIKMSIDYIIIHIIVIILFYTQSYSPVFYPISCYINHYNFFFIHLIIFFFFGWLVRQRSKRS